MNDEMMKVRFYDIDFVNRDKFDKDEIIVYIRKDWYEDFVKNYDNEKLTEFMGDELCDKFYGLCLFDIEFKGFKYEILK